MPITFTIADDLAQQLKPYQNELPEILELGIREWQARRQNGYQGISSVLERLAVLPNPEEILALRPAPPLQDRVNTLLEKSRTVGLSPEEQREWDEYEYVEHVVRVAKASAVRKLEDAKTA